MLNCKFDFISYRVNHNDYMLRITMRDKLPIAM